MINFLSTLCDLMEEVIKSGDYLTTVGQGYKLIRGLTEKEKAILTILAREDLKEKLFFEGSNCDEAVLQDLLYCSVLFNLKNKKKDDILITKDFKLYVKID